MKTRSRLVTGIVALTVGCVPLAFAATSPTASSSTQQTQKTTASHSQKSAHGHISAAQIEGIQKALTANGFAVKADGHWGKKTKEAVEQFQKKNGLKVTGHLNKATLAKLGITPAK